MGHDRKDASRKPSKVNAMAPNIREPLAYAAASGGGNGGTNHDVISRIYLIRHGDRFDYA